MTSCNFRPFWTPYRPPPFCTMASLLSSQNTQTLFSEAWRHFWTTPVTPLSRPSRNCQYLFVIAVTSLCYSHEHSCSKMIIWDRALFKPWIRSKRDRYNRVWRYCYAMRVLKWKSEKNSNKIFCFYFQCRI